jgi:Sulfate permease family
MIHARFRAQGASDRLSEQFLKPTPRQAESAASRPRLGPSSDAPSALRAEKPETKDAKELALKFRSPRVPVAMAAQFRFRPRLLDSLRGYNAARAATDIGSGIVVGIIALPLAMAFGIASSVTPLAGLVTAVIAGFIISN